MKKIQLTNGMESIVDDDMFSVLSSYTWSLSGGRGVYKYAYTNGGKYMHRLVIGAKPGEYVDHINGNSLDNRKENLRICTSQENRRNSRKRQLAASKYKGVCKHSRRDAWRAMIRYNEKSHYLGYFKSEEEAALAYNEAAKEFFGEFAVLNEVPN